MIAVHPRVTLAYDTRRTLNRRLTKGQMIRTHHEKTESCPYRYGHAEIDESPKPELIVMAKLV
jgi:hypothetical protein